jgi:hypothetical protein
LPGSADEGAWRILMTPIGAHLPGAAYYEVALDVITIGLGVFAALLLAIGIWWVWWRLPKQEVARLALKIRDQKARADVEDNYRKTVGQALGGVVVLIGAIKELQRARDSWQTQAERLALMAPTVIAAPGSVATPEAAAPTPAAPEPRRPWWRRLAG